MDSVILYRDDADAGLDLSEYVDLAAGGLNPGDAEVREGLWTGNSSSYGQALAGEKLSNRNVSIALLLNGVTTDELTALHRSIQERLDGPRPHLGWQREGATSTAYFRVKYGRLLGSERYDQRLEAQTRNARRMLSLQCSPFAEADRRRTADFSLIYATGPAGWTTWASGAGVAPSAIAMAGPMPSIGGDVSAAMRILIGRASSPSSPAYIDDVAWGLTGQASFLPAYMLAGAPGAHASGGATFLTGMAYYGNGTLTGPTTVGSAPAALVPGGKYLSFLGTWASAAKNLNAWHTIVSHVAGATNAGSYSHAVPNPGRYRVYMIARAMQNFSEYTVALRDINGQVNVATLANNASFFVLHDMGDHEAAVRAQQWEVQIWRASSGISSATSYASPAVQIAGIVLVPKDIGFGQWKADDLQLALGANPIFFDGLEPEEPMVWGQASGLPAWDLIPPASAMYPNGGKYRGDRPELPYTPSGGAATPLYMVALSQSYQLGIPNGIVESQRPIVAFMLQDRYTFAP